MRSRTRPARRTVRHTVAALAVAVIATPVLAAPAWTDSGRSPARGGDHEALQQAMDTVVREGIPGVVAQARDADGVWRGTTGVGNLKNGKPRSTQDRFRIASITKTFVATVMLQLEAEGRLRLDDTVDHWLPGVVRGHGHDGRKITLRQLLNHTSGVFDYLNDPAYVRKYVLAPGFLKHRYDIRTPQEALDVALSHAPDFPPGTRYQYSNTNYVLAALIMEKASNDSYENQIHQRIIKPLGLRGTSAPGDTAHMPRPSSRAYSTLSLDPEATKIYDVTVQNASQSWGDGDLISTTGDLSRFLTALLRGELLPPEQLTSMMTTVPHPEDPTTGIGLGIGKYVTSCGVTVWGHDGGWIGSSSEVVATVDGSHTLAYNLNGDWAMPANLVDAEFCGTQQAPEPGAGKQSGRAEDSGRTGNRFPPPTRSGLADQPAYVRELSAPAT